MIAYQELCRALTHYNARLRGEQPLEGALSEPGVFSSVSGLAALASDASPGWGGGARPDSGGTFASTRGDEEVLDADEVSGLHELPREADHEATLINPTRPTTETEWPVKAAQAKTVEFDSTAFAQEDAETYEAQQTPAPRWSADDDAGGKPTDVK